MYMKAFGMDLLLLSKDAADPFHPQSCRASAGAISDIPILTLTTERLRQLAELGTQFSLVTAQEGRSLSDLNTSKKQAFVLGSEGQGLSEGLITELTKLTALHYHHIDMETVPQ